MIQFDENGKAHLLPEEDGTIDPRTRAAELRFLKMLNSGLYVVPLSGDAFLIDASSSEEPN